MKKPERPESLKNPGKFNKRPPTKEVEVIVWKTPPFWYDDDVKWKMRDYYYWSEEDRKKMFINLVEDACK